MPRLHVIYDPADRVETPKSEWLRSAKAIVAVVPVDPDNLRASVSEIVDLVMKNIEGTDEPGSG